MDVEKIYEERLEEINDYFNYLKNINCNSRISSMLISNGLLMLYNLTEMVIYYALEEVYNKMKEEKLCYNDVSSDIKQMWLDYEIKKIHKDGNNYEKLKNKTRKLINFIQEDQVLNFEKKTVNINGNLNLEKIKTICNLHGIEIEFNSINNPENIGNILKKRNELSHGSLSFVEVGRDYSFNDLEKNKETVTNLLEEYIRNVKKYILKMDYINR